jgi:hypothetical protein
MAYTDSIEILGSANLLAKAKIAMLDVAQYVVGGGGAPTAIVVANAREAILNPDVAVAPFMTYLAKDATILANKDNSTYDQVYAVVNAKFTEWWSA